MILNLNKSVITDQQYIQTSSNECNFGFPQRPLDKMLAQLCNGRGDKYMSMGAIGIAYASCGQDRTFTNYVKMYTIHSSYAEPPTKKSPYRKWQQILDKVGKWKGELPFTPKLEDTTFCELPYLCSRKCENSV